MSVAYSIVIAKKVNLKCILTKFLQQQQHWTDKNMTKYQEDTEMDGARIELR